jgi:hypothetical protein
MQQRINILKAEMKRFPKCNVKSKSKGDGKYKTEKTRKKVKALKYVSRIKEGENKKREK